jgi:hypothetical protein
MVTRWDAGSDVSTWLYARVMQIAAISSREVLTRAEHPLARRGSDPAGVTIWGFKTFPARMYG